MSQQADSVSTGNYSQSYQDDIFVAVDSWVKPPENQTDVIGNINTHLAWTVGSTDYYLFDLDGKHKGTCGNVHCFEF